MARSSLQIRIDREKAKLAKLCERIAQLMSARVGVEEKLAKLYEEGNRTGCADCGRPEFWEGHAMFNGRAVSDHEFKTT